MNRITTELRNRMNTTTLDRLLRIRIEGPEDFPHIEAATRWSRAKKRRLLILGKVKQRQLDWFQDSEDHLKP